MGLAASLAAVGALLATIAIGAAIMADHFRTSADENRKLAHEAEQRSDELTTANRQLRWNGYVADMVLARQAWDDNNLSRARELLQRHIPQNAGDDLRGFEWHYLKRQMEMSKWHASACGGWLTSLAFSDDGERLTSGGLIRAGTRQNEIDVRGIDLDWKVWDAATGRELPADFPVLESGEKIVAQSDDRRLLLIVAGNGTLQILGSATGIRTVLEDATQQPGGWWEFSRDNQFVARHFRPPDDLSRTPSGIVDFWNARTGRRGATIQNLTPFSAAERHFSPDGKQFALNLSDSQSIKIFETESAREISVIRPPHEVVCCGFTPDGTSIAVAGRGPGVTYWDLATQHQGKVLPTSTVNNSLLAFNGDGSKLAVGGWDGVIELVDTVTGKTSAILKGHVGPVIALSFSRDGAILASGGADGDVRYWNVHDVAGELQLAAGIHTWADNIVSPDGKVAVTGLEPFVIRGPVQFWDSTTGDPRTPPLDVSGPFDWHEWTDDSQLLYLGAKGGEISVLAVPSGEVLHRWRFDVDKSARFALSSQQKKIAHATPDGPIRIRFANTGEPMQIIDRVGAPAHLMAFDASGARLALVDKAGNFGVWDVKQGSEVMQRPLNGLDVNSLCVSRDGRWLALMGKDERTRVGRTEIVRLADGTTYRDLYGHTLAAVFGDFSPDGERFVSGGMDHSVRLFDLSTGQEMLALKKHRAGVSTVRFIDDGRRIISVDDNANIHFWDATPNQKDSK